MTGELNHKCIICGANYHYCNDCGRMKSFTPWRTICDTEEHYQIYMVLHGLDNKFIDKQEAVNQLSNIGITIANISGLKPIVQAAITDIFKEDFNDAPMNIKSVTKGKKE